MQTAQEATSMLRARTILHAALEKAKETLNLNIRFSELAGFLGENLPLFFAREFSAPGHTGSFYDKRGSVSQQEIFQKVLTIQLNMVSSYCEQVKAAQSTLAPQRVLEAV
jgi:hypothetical protein